MTTLKAAQDTAAEIRAAIRALNFAVEKAVRLQIVVELEIIEPQGLYCGQRQPPRVGVDLRIDPDILTEKDEQNAPDDRP